MAKAKTNKTTTAPKTHKISLTARITTCIGTLAMITSKPEYAKARKDLVLRHGAEAVVAAEGKISALTTTIQAKVVTARTKSSNARSAVLAPRKALLAALFAAAWLTACRVAKDRGITNLIDHLTTWRHPGKVGSGVTIRKGKDLSGTMIGSYTAPTGCHTTVDGVQYKIVLCMRLEGVQPSRGSRAAAPTTEV